MSVWVRPPGFGTVRLGFYYAAVFGFVGVFQPFWPVWLTLNGLSAWQVGVIVSLPLWVKVAAAPIAAAVADRSGRSKPVMVMLALCGCAVFAGFAGAHEFAAIAVLAALFAVVWTPLIPLGESLTLLTLRRARVEHGRASDYGRVRLWGSLAYIGAVNLAGAGLGVVTTGRAEATLILAMIGGALVLVAVSCLTLPDTRSGASAMPDGQPGNGLRLRSVLKVPGFALFLLGAGAIQSSHAVYYAFASVHWRAAGLADSVIAGLWAEGVLAEVVLFWAAARLFGQASPGGILALAGAIGVVRWVAFSLEPGLAGLAAAQLGHAFTFGAAHLAVMRFIELRVPAGLSASAQSAYSALAVGIGFGLIMPAAGWLYAEAGASAYLAMAGLAGCASVCGLALRRRRAR